MDRLVIYSGNPLESVLKTSFEHGPGHRVKWDDFRKDGRQVVSIRAAKGSHFTYFLAGTAQSVQRLVTGWTVWRSNSGENEIFRMRPDRSRGPPSLPYDRYPAIIWDKTAGTLR